MPNPKPKTQRKARKLRVFRGWAIFRKSQRLNVDDIFFDRESAYQVCNDYNFNEREEGARVIPLKVTIEFWARAQRRNG